MSRFFFWFFWYNVCKVERGVAALRLRRLLDVSAGHLDPFSVLPLALKAKDGRKTVNSSSVFGREKTASFELNC